MRFERNIYLSLGSNQGNKSENLQSAITLIAEKIGDVLKIASVYKTPALGFEGNDFLNTCIEISTYLSPEILIKKLLEIENKLGRIRVNDNYTNRNIDIDILLFDDEIICSEDLIVPHPRMLERKFVLIPLVEIAKNVLHPVERIDLLKCLNKCSDNSKITKINKKLTKPNILIEIECL